MMAWHLQQQAMKKRNAIRKRKLCAKCGKLGHYSNECDDVETIKM